MPEEFSVENFIYQKKNVLSEDLCKEIIGSCDHILESVSHIPVDERPYGVATSDIVKQLYGGGFNRTDEQIFLPYMLSELYLEVKPLIMKCLEEYQSVIDSIADKYLESIVIKLQRTQHGGGFSRWHVEQDVGGCANRALAWMINLNTIEGSGDTEFLYQGVKSPAESGKMTIFPAGLTHPHRGNPPYGQSKYILTGWFEFPIAEHFARSSYSGFEPKDAR